MTSGLGASVGNSLGASGGSGIATGVRRVPPWKFGVGAAAMIADWNG